MILFNFCKKINPNCHYSKSEACRSALNQNFSTFEDCNVWTITTKLFAFYSMQNALVLFLIWIFAQEFIWYPCESFLGSFFGAGNAPLSCGCTLNVKFVKALKRQVGKFTFEADFQDKFSLSFHHLEVGNLKKIS